MNRLYNFFGGRKLFYFNFMFLTNLIALLNNSWVDGFGWFSIGLYSVVVLGIEGNKYIKGRTNE
jgi:hypothetical protein